MNPHDISGDQNTTEVKEGFVLRADPSYVQGLIRSIVDRSASALWIAKSLIASLQDEVELGIYQRFFHISPQPK